jgi:hypothetical protein
MNLMFKFFLCVMISAGCCFPLPDTTNSAFFSRLEKQLQADYAFCTGDSARLPVKTLIVWKHRVDSLAGLPGYPAIAREYTKETGNSPVTDLPCRVIRWKLAKDSLAAVPARTAEVKRETDTMTKANNRAP